MLLVGFVWRVIRRLSRRLIVFVVLVLGAVVIRRIVRRVVVVWRVVRCFGFVSLLPLLLARGRFVRLVGFVRRVVRLFQRLVVSVILLPGAVVVWQIVRQVVVAWRAVRCFGCV